MKTNKARAKQNIEYAQAWLNRSNKDFTQVKKLVRFDKNTNKTVRCADPALAVYLLQQTVEKAVKATAVATGLYQGTDFTRVYRHNSLGLILDLFNKMVTQMNGMGFDSLSKMVGLNLVEGQSKLLNVENQVMGTVPLFDKAGKKVNFDSESRSLTAEAIDQILNMLAQNRVLTLRVIKDAFSSLSSLGLQKGNLDPNANPIDVLEKFNDSFKTNSTIKPLSDEQIGAVVEGVLEIMSKMSGPRGKPYSIPKRKELNVDYLGVWALTQSLYFLTYLTYAHEATSRYPLKKKGDIKRGRIGCDDYHENLGIVNRLGQIGYITGLTINDLKEEINSVALFFSIEQNEH